MATDIDGTLFEKIVFTLEQNEDGYPPVARELLWGALTPDGQYKIDSIPFYARGVSPGDTVSARLVDGEFHFHKVVHQSDDSVLRVFGRDAKVAARIRTELIKIGCLVERSHLPRLMAVLVPSASSASRVIKLLRSEKSRGTLDF